MEKTKKTLRLQLAAYLGAAAVVALLYETGALTEGALVGDTMAGTQMLTQMAMTILALAGIPLALKLLHINKVREQVAGGQTARADGQGPAGSDGNARAARRLLAWGTLQLALIGLPMVADVLCYYLFGADVRFFYLAVIEAVALCFTSTKAPC